jgi:excinuclease ABC subunit A
MELISLLGVKTHNLKNINCSFPIGCLTGVTGVSGSGKSSLVFDTLYGESYRRYLGSLSSFARQYMKSFPKPNIDTVHNLPPAVAVTAKGSGGHGHRSTVGTLTELSGLMELLFGNLGKVFCYKCQAPVYPATEDSFYEFLSKNPSLGPFSIGTPTKAPIPFLLELGYSRGLSSKGVPFSLEKSKKTSFILFLDELTLPMDAPRAQGAFQEASRLGSGTFFLFDKHKNKTTWTHSWTCLPCNIAYDKPDPALFSFSHPLGACGTCQGAGIIWDEGKWWHRTHSVCPSCQGARLKETARSVFVEGVSYQEAGLKNIKDLSLWIRSLPFASHEEEIRDEILVRLSFIEQTCLGYLNLSRSSKTLSGGELQRISMARSLGTLLTDTLFCLDEPTRGLHPKDTQALLSVLRNLRDQGNTVVVVEHEGGILREVDHLITLGPKGGPHGGQIIFEGPPRDYKEFEWPEPHKKNKRLKDAPWLRLSHVQTQTLQNITVDFPLGTLIGVCGVSGSGKTSLIGKTLYPLWLKSQNLETQEEPKGQIGPKDVLKDILTMELVGQETLGRSSRSTIGTYLGILPLLRDLYGKSLEAQKRKLTPKDFSFNSPGGRCETCHGLGMVTEDLSFLGDVDLVCPECEGKRFRPEILEVFLEGYHFSQILDKTVTEVGQIFSKKNPIRDICEQITTLGLGYLTLGQKTSSFSGGEAHRLKLLALLKDARKDHRGFYIFDEPTTGLSDQDIGELLKQLQTLVDLGHTVLVIEHHLGLLKQVDWLIELGPGAGPDGGQLVFQGAPVALADQKDSPTGAFFKKQNHH